MSYEPTNWKAGDTVTSAKLNKLEQGVASAGGGVLLVTASWNEQQLFQLDKTWQEIHDSPITFIRMDYGGDDTCTAIVTETYASTFEVSALQSSDGELDTILFAASNADGYPAYESEPSA